MTRLFRYLSGPVTALLLALSPMAVSCSSPAADEPLTPLSVTIKTTTVSGEAGSQFLSVTASGSWTLSSTADWVSFSPATGTGSSDRVVLSYGENPAELRSAVIVLTGNGGSASATLTQSRLSGGGSARGYGAKTASGRWMELPETSATDGYEFFTHDMTISSTRTRNYSFYWDYDHLVARWVAYPLCAWNIGSGNRSDKWGEDPSLPKSLQPLLEKAYTGGWSRGHQIPSADRLNYAANVQTFYYTNMTPQDYNFNGGTWANLETQVRAWARKTGATAGTDTLYVVTGCTLGASPTTVRDNVGKAVAVPEGYFKALLRYKKDASVGHKGYMGCAFWFENKDKYASKITKDMSISLSDLEKIVGYKLFVNLDAAVGAETAKAIRDEKPATVSWWWQ